MKNIILLGDSTSMTIGAEGRSYPFLLSNRSVYKEELRLINSSQPGMTTTDAAAFFLRQIKDKKDIASVIIYLGNCDANATELKKGGFTKFKEISQNIKDIAGIKPRKIKLYNKLLRFQWNENYNPYLENPENLDDFEYNLKRIVKECNALKIPVILIRPRSHYFFPAGIGKGNFIFYHYFDLNPKLSEKLEHPDQRFLDAFKAYEEGNYDVSKEIYKSILGDLECGPSTPEYATLVAHNYAVCSAKLGLLNEADVIFKLLLKDWNNRREIFLYNYAFIKKHEGKSQEFSKLMDEAYETDTSMYRVKGGHLNAIDKVKNAFPETVNILDMKDFDDDLFVDHCHLVSSGQKILEDKILSIFENLSITGGNASLTIENMLFNPELGLGNADEFYKYYKTYAPYSEEDIKKDASRIVEDHRENGDLTDESLAFVSENMSRAIKYFKRHPLFASTEDICRSLPEYPSDIGRFPEFCLIRQIVPYLRNAEKKGEFKDIFKRAEGLLRRSDDLLKVLPDDVKALVEEDLPNLDKSSIDEWVARTIKNAKKVLEENLSLGSQIEERLMTTIFWYFRETLRLGSHSRVSMRYDRINLEYAAEAIFIAAWLDSLSTNINKEELRKIANILVDTVCIHEKYSTEYKPCRNNEVLLKNYNGDLRNLLKQLKDIEENLICQQTR